MGISSKITLYDFLCMLVCGYLILCILTGMGELPNNNVLLYILSYLVGMVYHKAIYPLLGNMQCMVMRSWNKVNKDIDGELPQGSMNDYYKGYYYLMEKNCLNNIPVLEAQVAFCKDVFFLLLLIIVEILSGCCHVNFFGNACLLNVLLVVLCVALPFVWYVTQMKIHYLVWEGAYYLKKLEKEKNEKSNS